MASKVSIKTVLNTPQAVDDSFAALEDLISYLDVLDNDGGGNAATLYALIGTGLTASQITSALQAPVRTNYETGLGAMASIITTGENAGTIAYDASSLDHLSEGEVVTDTFSYVIQLGNGTFSIATVTVTVTGTNDRPTVGDVTIGADAGIVEDGPVYRGSFAGDDVDNDDDPTSLIYQIVSPPQPGKGTVMIDPDHSAGFIFDPGADFQDLEEGETDTVTFTYQAVDRHGAVSVTRTVTITITGTADDTDGALVDGYIANALIFRDSNNNSLWDHESFTDANDNGIFDAGEVYEDTNGDLAFTAEFFTVTDQQGNFTGLGGTGRIVAAPLTGSVVTTDISTGEAWTGLYSAPEGSSVVTPLTTVLDSLAGPGATAQEIADAQATLAAALGIDPSVDLASYDPIAALQGETDPAALALAVEVQKIAVQVANIIAVIDETLQAAGVEDGGALASAALAAQIEGSAGATDLTSTALIQTVIEEAATASGDPAAQAAVEDQSAAIAEALSGINEVIDAVDETGDPLGALAEVVAAQIVAQENLATEAAAAVGSGDPVDTTAYEGTSLVDQLDQAATEVETIIPEEDTGSSLGTPERPVVDDGVRVNAAEIADGIQVTVTYDETAGVIVGDTLKLMLNGVEIASHTLAAGEISSGGQLSYVFTVPESALGDDGSKVLTAQFATAGGVAGPTSLPALLTVDTVAPDQAYVVPLAIGFGSQVAAGDGSATFGQAPLFNDTLIGFLITNNAGAPIGGLTVSAVPGDGSPAIGLTFNAASGQYVPASPLPAGAFQLAIAGATAGQPIAVTRLAMQTTINAAEAQGALALGGPAGAVVTVSGLGLDGNPLTVTASATQFGYQLTPAQIAQFQDGALTIQTVLTDAAGNSSTPGIYVAQLDRQAPGAPALGVDPAIAGGVSRAELLAGFALNISLAGTGAKVGDRLEVVQDGEVTDSHIITQADLDAGSYAHTLEAEEAELAGIDGAYTFSARIVDAGGNTGASAAELTLTVDTVAPGFPTELHMAEGTIITTAEAADGTQLVGQTDLGNSVTFTFRNSANQTLVKEATVTGTNVSVTLSAAEIATLGEGYVSYTAVARDAAGNVSGFNLTGQYFHTDQPIVDAANRIDVAGAYAEQNQDVQADVTALPGGGFAISWLTDSDDDGESDSFAFQKYTADGAKDGAPVVLQGLATNIGLFGEQVDTYDLTALDNGTYVLAYALAREEISTTLTLNSSPGGQFVTPLTGVPQSFQVINYTPVAGGSPPRVFLSGTGTNGLPLNNVELALVDGEYRVTQQILDLFLIDNRFQVIVNNIAGSTLATLIRHVAEDVVFDTEAPLATEVFTRVVPSVNPGAGVAFFNAVRAEYFHIDSRVDSNGQPITTALPNGTFQIIPSTTGSISIAGIANAQILVNGVIQIAGIAPDGNGNYYLPPAILSQLGTHDAAINLILPGQPFGSTFTATAYKTAPVTVPSVFVQTFDANGVATSDGNTPVSSLPYVSPEDDDGFTVETSALPGGGFAVHWLTDTNGDGDGDTFAIQRYGANRQPDGPTITLSGLSTTLLQNGENAENLDLTALEDGTYALAYSLEREIDSKIVNLNSVATQVGLGGIPTEISVLSAPVGAAFNLQGLDNDGLPLTVGLQVVDGMIQVTQAILNQFGQDNRLFLGVTGLAQGQSASFFVQTEAAYAYNPVGATTGLIAAGNVNVFNPFFSLGAFGSNQGRVEGFHLDQPATFNLNLPLANRYFEIRISVPFEASVLNLSGMTGQNGVDGVSIDPVTGQILIRFNSLILEDFAIPQQLLDQIGGRDFQAVLLAFGLNGPQPFGGTLDVRAGTEVPQGVFVQTFGVNGVATSTGSVQIDGPGALLATEEEGNVNVSALPGSGFTVDWITDADDSGYSDSGAVQRFNSSGVAVGDTVVISDVPDVLIDYEGGTDIYSMTALDNGGYALAYAVERPTDGKAVTVSIGGQYPTSFGIGGVPIKIVVTSAPANATYQLQGYDADENPLTFDLEVVNGEIHVPREFLDQMAEPHRAILAVNDLLPGQTANLWIVTDQAVTFDTSTSLTEVARTGSINEAAPGVWNVGILTTLDGRSEGFHLDAQAVFNSVDGQPRLFQMLITPAFDPYSINLTGIVGQGGVNAAFVNPLGQIVLLYFNTAQMDFMVPQTILDQVGERDMFNVLLGIGLAPSVTSFSGSIDVRDAIAIPEGVFVQTFDENGAPAADLTVENASIADLLFGDVGDDTIIASGIVNVMVGGPGEDTFRVEANNAAFNTIFDFTPGSDVIDLSGLDAITATPGDQEFLFIGNSAFSGVAGELRFDTTPDGIVLLMDRDGNMTDDYRIFLPGNGAIDPEDLIL